LAKEMFQIHGVDMHGIAVLRKKLRRREMANFHSSRAMIDWHGSLRQCSSLGKEVGGAWTYREAHGAAVC
jgi:hypothetical protein